VKLQIVIGANMARIRGDAGRTQQDVADVARSFGLAWDRSVIAAVERGAKPVTVEALAVLPAVLAAIAGHPVTVADLLDSEDLVTLTPAASASARAVGEILAGHSKPDALSIAHGDRDSRPAVDAVRRRAADLGLPSGDEHEWVRLAGEAEARVARRIGEPAGIVVGLSLAAWGRTFREEREARVAGKDVQGDARASAGQVTRALQALLLEDVKRRIAAVNRAGGRADR
jgi:hypothetical protein